MKRYLQFAVIVACGFLTGSCAAQFVTDMQAEFVRIDTPSQASTGAWIKGRQWERDAYEEGVTARLWYQLPITANPYTKSPKGKSMWERGWTEAVK